MHSHLVHARPAVRIWLLSICLLLIAMITLGGITRLTGSGLSITDWKPIVGAIPPRTDAAWEIAFAKYREIPQFKLLNSTLTLSEFKSIYFWEWLHRLVGRLIGIVAFLPGLYFWMRGRITWALAQRVLLGVFLGGLQGALGWFMVKSGLSERTSVSHYRLAAHLGLALLILAYFTTLTRSVFEGQRTLSLGKLGAAEFLRAKFPYVVALFALQIFYGAFVAGLKAGFAYNTFPLMAGSLFPTELFAWDPISRSALENPATVQWIHRALGTLTLLAANGLWWGVRRRENPGGELRYWAGLLAGATNLQFALGIATLLFVVPVPLGALHQFGAAILVVLLSVFSHASRRGLKKEPRSVNL